MGLNPDTILTRVPVSMPIVPTSLVGRAADADHLIHLLTSEAVRLVTITGPGGVGKTRLALHVAAHLVDAFPDGPVFIPLAPVASVDLVLPTILQHLGGYETGDASPFDQVLEILHGRHILLVLDNLEHLLACASELGRLVAACEGVVVLATSKAPLGVSNERVYPLQSLDLPGPAATTDEIYASDAVTLFVERASAVNPRLITGERNAASIAELCRQLDGLPLAIELAASRSSILNPRAILERLDHRFTVLTSTLQDVPERLRTLRNAIGWSYDLLDPVEQRMFRWLSVFADGIPLEAVEAMPPAGTPLDREPLDLLTHLVDRSLVRTVMTPERSPRYLMLETIRAFGHEQLLHAGDDEAARTWHANWFANLAAERGRQSLRQEDVEILSEEWGNLRQALDWFLHHTSPSPALALCGNLWRFWSMRGMATEGRTWTNRALDMAPPTDTPERAEALIAAGYLAEDQNDYAEAERQLRASLAISEQLGDRGTMAGTLSGLGCIAHDQRDYPRALAWHRKALEMAIASDNQRARAVALGNLGAVYYLLADYPKARSSCEEGVAILQELGDRQGESILLSNLGAHMLELGDLVAARAYLERSIALLRTLGDRRSAAYGLINLAEAYFRLGDLETPLPMLAEAVETLMDGASAGDAAIARITVARVHLARGDIQTSISALHIALIALQQRADYANSAEAAELLAQCALALGAVQEARTLIIGATVQREQIQAPIRPTLAADTDAVKERIRAVLGPDALDPIAPDDRAHPLHDHVSDAIRIAANLAYRASTPLPGTNGLHAPDQPSDAQADHPTSQEYGLSDRELDVLRLLADGKSTREIADQLFIAPRTAATHINNIIGKMGVGSRTAAVALAMRLGIV